MDGLGKGNESSNPTFNSQGDILIFISFQEGKNPKRLHQKYKLLGFL